MIPMSMCNMAVNETPDHLIVECLVYNQSKHITMRSYKEFLRETKISEIISADDNELGF